MEEARHEAETTYQISMLFRRDPEVSIAPSTQVTEFLDLGMCVLHVIFHGQARRVIYADVAAQTPENAANLEGEKFRIRAILRQRTLLGQNGTRDGLFHQEGDSYRCLKLPYKTSTFSRCPVLTKSR
jgi:hypothetical protein